MLRKLALLPILLLAACSPSGKLENPFVKKPPFVATPVPPDFVIIIDENHDTYYTRQHIQQVITSADAMSRTTYAYYRDYNDSVPRKFSTPIPLNAAQLQDMWNSIQTNEIMMGSRPFINWASSAEAYRRNAYTLQIRANGQSRTYQQVDGFPPQIRPLMLLTDAVRLPIGQDTKTPVVPTHAVPGAESTTLPATQPATQP